MAVHPHPAPTPGEGIKDLGFGSVVTSESTKRLLNRDGTFNVIREGLDPWSSLSLYHYLLTVSWPRFLGLVALAYLAANAGFAVAYLALGESALDGPPTTGLLQRGLQDFFFSIQTFATIGYGRVNPAGLGANLLVTMESLVGLLGFALATGLVFARFSRPTARILFSDRAVITPGGRPAFMLRIANARSSQLIEVGAHVLFSGRSSGSGGREFHELSLERDRVAFFPLSWTIVHSIDEASPLYGLTEEDFRRRDVEFLVLLTGIDETFAQTVHARSSYQAAEVAWNARFLSVFNRHRAHGDLSIDMRCLSRIEEAAGSMT
jgi:inward rectifier potassium channel